MVNLCSQTGHESAVIWAASWWTELTDFLKAGRQSSLTGFWESFQGSAQDATSVSGHSTHSKSKMILNLCICKDLFSNEVNFAGSRDTSLGVTPIQSMTKGKADEHLNKGKGRRRGNYTELLLKPARIHGAKWGGELFSLIMVTRAVEYWMGIQHGCTREEGCPPLRLPLRGHHIVATAE